ncbi:hypothetical protein IJM86_06945 [bacterium]|nr:hypothetical protein [bacterium]
MMNAMFQTGKFDYLDNIAMIKANTQKVEQIFRNQIIGEEKRKEITQLEKKMLRKRKRNQRRGRFCTIPTLGIYKLFW